MDLARNWQVVEERIQAACERADRERDAVSLVAVSKGAKRCGAGNGD